MKPHRVDLVSGFFGIVFLGLGATILAGHGDVSLRYLTVLGPVLLVAFGFVLVAAAVRRQRPAAQPVLAVEEPPSSYSSATYTAPLERTPENAQGAPDGAAGGDDTAPFDPGADPDADTDADPDGEG